MLLEDMFDYKNQLIKDIVTNDEIVNLIAPNGGTKSPSSLIYKQIFPYEYLPETTQDGYTYVCCEVDIQAVQNSLILTPVIYVWVFSHKSTMRLPEGGVRTDKICSLINKTINGSMYYGLGQLNLMAVKRFAPMTDYNGKLMTFTVKEVNRVFDGKKSIPSNRKGR